MLVFPRYVITHTVNYYRIKDFFSEFVYLFLCLFTSLLRIFHTDENLKITDSGIQFRYQALHVTYIY